MEREEASSRAGSSAPVHLARVHASRRTSAGASGRGGDAARAAATAQAPATAAGRQRQRSTARRQRQRRRRTPPPGAWEAGSPGQRPDRAAGHTGEQAPVGVDHAGGHHRRRRGDRHGGHRRGGQGQGRQADGASRQQPRVGLCRNGDPRRPPRAGRADHDAHAGGRQGHPRGGAGSGPGGAPCPGLRPGGLRQQELAFALHRHHPGLSPDHELGRRVGVQLHRRRHASQPKGRPHRADRGQGALR